MKCLLNHLNICLLFQKVAFKKETISMLRFVLLQKNNCSNCNDNYRKYKDQVLSLLQFAGEYFLFQQSFPIFLAYRLLIRSYNSSQTYSIEFISGLQVGQLSCSIPIFSKKFCNTLAVCGCELPSIKKNAIQMARKAQSNLAKCR